VLVLTCCLYSQAAGNREMTGRALCEAFRPQGGVSRQLIIFLDTCRFIPAYKAGLSRQDTGNRSI
jgi:hypothetical protein